MKLERQARRYATQDFVDEIKFFFLILEFILKLNLFRYLMHLSDTVRVGFHNYSD